MNTLKAEKRSMDVKAKKLRREGFVTGNLFGKEIEGSIPLKMDRFEVDRLLKTDHKGSQIMLNVEGQDYDVLIKEVDYNAMKRCVDEIDFPVSYTHLSRRGVSCSLAKAISREKLEKGQILYELYHRFSLCDGCFSPCNSIQSIKLSDERH